MKQVAELVGALQNEMTQLIGNADATTAKLIAWGDMMQHSHDALSSGAANIQSAEADLAPETGGASLLVAGTGGLLVIGGAVTWGVMQHKINEQYDEIAKDKKELGDDQRQMVALQGLATSTDQAVTYITTSTSALSDFRTSWTVFEGELKGVASQLAKAEASLSTISRVPSPRRQQTNGPKPPTSRSRFRGPR